jgi:hypothetical protein
MKSIKLIIAAVLVMAGMSVMGQWSTNGTNAYYNGGNVGIGTSSPAQLLNMINPSGGASNILLERNHTGTSGITGIGSYLVKNSGTGDMAYFGLRKNGTTSDLVMSCFDQSANAGAGAWREFIYFYFATRKYTIQSGVGDVEYLNTGNIILNNNGGVSIGTSTIPSGYKLAVDGSIICEELVVKLSQEWPDYVFDENYYLKPLNEVDSFIKENGHLPGIKSAKEIKEDGISLGEMNKQLMEKIEELTLYVIQLNKDIEALKNK